MTKKVGGGKAGLDEDGKDSHPDPGVGTEPPRREIQNNWDI